MQQIKKWGAVGGAIAVVLCWPLAVGSIGQNVIIDGIGNLNSDVLKAEIVAYDRGYLSSLVTTRYHVTDPQLIEQLKVDGLPSEFTVTSDVSHGLMSLSAHSVVDEAAQLPLVMDSTTQLNGNTDFNIQLDNWHYVSKNNQNVMVSLPPSSLTGTITVLGELSYQLDVPSMELDFASGDKLSITSIKAQGQGKRTHAFWIGDQQITIGQAKIVSPDQVTSFEMMNASYHFTSNEIPTTNRVSGQHVLEMNDLKTDQGQVSNFNVDVSFGDLDSVAFGQLLDVYQNNPNPSLSNAQLQTAIESIETLFAQGFYVSVNDFSAKIGDGEFRSAMNIQVPEGTKDVAANPMAVLPKLTGDVESYVSEQMVETFPTIKQAIDEAIVMDIVDQTQSGYRIEAQLENSNLVFKNGQKIPLMALILPMML